MGDFFRHERPELVCDFFDVHDRVFFVKNTDVLLRFIAMPFEFFFSSSFRACGLWVAFGLDIHGESGMDLKGMN